MASKRGLSDILSKQPGRMRHHRREVIKKDPSVRSSRDLQQFSTADFNKDVRRGGKVNIFDEQEGQANGESDEVYGIRFYDGDEAVIEEGIIPLSPQPSQKLAQRTIVSTDRRYEENKGSVIVPDNHFH